MLCNCFVVLIFSIGIEVLPATEVFLGIEPSRNVVLTYYTRLTFQYYSWNLLQLSNEDRKMQYVKNTWSTHNNKKIQIYFTYQFIALYKQCCRTITIYCKKTFI